MRRNRIAALLALLLAFLLLFSACAPQELIGTVSEVLGEVESAVSAGESLLSEAETDLPMETGPPEETEAPEAPEASAEATEPPEAPSDEPSGETAAEPEALDRDGEYTGAEEVALYLHLYHHLPRNFITKQKAQSLGWSGGSLEPYAPGKSIGGDKFGNREGLLPKKQGRVYYECDIGTKGKSSRGAKRIVWSNDGLIYYTDDHYESFERLY